MSLSHFFEMRGTVQVEIGCPACGVKLSGGKMLEGNDDAQLSHYECAQCAQYSVALVYQSQMGIASVVVMTDSCFDDIVRLRSGKVITPDDVIGLHTVLNDDVKMSKWLQSLNK